MTTASSPRAWPASSGRLLDLDILHLDVLDGDLVGGPALSLAPEQGQGREPGGGGPEGAEDGGEAGVGLCGLADGAAAEAEAAEEDGEGDEAGEVEEGVCGLDGEGGEGVGGAREEARRAEEVGEGEEGEDRGGDEEADLRRGDGDCCGVVPVGHLGEVSTLSEDRGGMVEGDEPYAEMERMMIVRRTWRTRRGRTMENFMLAAGGFAMLGVARGLMLAMSRTVLDGSMSRIY